MDVSAITTIISNVGFPIACVIALFWYVNGTMKEFTKTLQENSKLLEKLCVKLDEIRKEV